MVGDLVGFLRARFAEDARAALEASHPAQLGMSRNFCPDERWYWCYSETNEAIPLAEEDRTTRPHGFDGDHRARLWSVNPYANRATPGEHHHLALWDAGVRVGVAKHIARYDPARVLADLGAKERIVDEYERISQTARGPEVEDITVGAVFALEQTLLTLAATYGDHPDYRKEWQPGDADSGVS